jgi:hypothetical protein
MRNQSAPRTAVGGSPRCARLVTRQPFTDCSPSLIAAETADRSIRANDEQEIVRPKLGPPRALPPDHRGPSGPPVRATPQIPPPERSARLFRAMGAFARSRRPTALGATFVPVQQEPGASLRIDFEPFAKEGKVPCPNHGIHLDTISREETRSVAAHARPRSETPLPPNWQRWH